jgi:nitroreductase
MPDRPYPDFFQVVHRRRSVRAFADREVTPETLRRLADVVRYAPSSLDGRPWRLLAIRDRETKERLVAFKNRWCPPQKRQYAAEFLAHAPIVLVVCVDERRSHFRWIENGVIAGTYLMLAATALGLGSTFLTAYNLSIPDQIREAQTILGLPAQTLPVCLLPVGYPAGTAAPRTLRPLEDILTDETR